VPVFPVDLLHVATGERRSAELHLPARDRDREDFLSLWQPAFEERRTALQPKSQDEVAAYDLQDAHWEWDRKIGQRRSYLRTFAVSCDGQTQGLMRISLDPSDPRTRARCPEHHGHGLVYVDLIATAPWNRPRLFGAARYKGVGQVLLAAAVSLSVEEECCGRIGLHALPQSESWYRDRCGMTDLGTDPAYYPNYPLRYFEMTEAQARAFVG
jgi:hypothetical protein